MADKHRFQVFLEKRQIVAMRQIEESTGAPVAAQVRLAVDAWLKDRDVRPTTTARPRSGRSRRS